MLIKFDLIFNNQTISLFWGKKLINLVEKMGEMGKNVYKLIPTNFSHFLHLISREKFLASQFLVFFSRDNACQA